MFKKLEGVSFIEKFDETTGISSKVIIDWKSFQGKQDLKPQLIITDKDGEPVKSKGSNSHYEDLLKLWRGFHEPPLKNYKNQFPLPKANSEETYSKSQSKVQFWRSLRNS